MFYIMQPEERPKGYVNLSHSAEWVRWLNRNIPFDLDAEVRRRLSSNLKHLLVGLELKRALISPHQHRDRGDRPVLFEPYFQNLIQEFCVGAFSVIEGLGSAHWLSRNGDNGADGRRIYRNDWMPVLQDTYDGSNEFGLLNAVHQTVNVRDKLHQDQVGARADIDWHSFTYEAAFEPASIAISILLRRNADMVPEKSNLRG